MFSNDMILFLSTFQQFLRTVESMRKEKERRYLFLSIKVLESVWFTQLHETNRLGYPYQPTLLEFSEVDIYLYECNQLREERCSCGMCHDMTSRLL